VAKAKAKLDDAMKGMEEFSGNPSIKKSVEGSGKDDPRREG
jgi:hypothetical protein